MLDEHLSPRQRVAKALLLQQSYADFVKYFWPIIEPGTKLVWNWHLDSVCQHLQEVTEGKLRQLVIEIPPGTAKALAHDTPILTTWGWRKHGELQPGDHVFGPDGQPRRVLLVTDPWEAPAIDVVFDDGSSICAAEDHLWKVERAVVSVAPKYKRGRKTVVVPTSDLHVSDPQGSWTRRPDRIPLCQAVALPHRQFLIDPYVLGAWLGDGTSSAGAISASHQDIEHFQTLGRIGTPFQPSGTRKQLFYRIVVKGLQTKLRVLGLLNNKHIPAEYLEGSIEQRWALVQGLMDTDGTCSASGSCSFTNKNVKMAEDLVAILQSLGVKASLTMYRTMLKGKQYGMHAWVVFTPLKGTQVFRLARKQERVRGARNARTQCRYVQELRPVGTRGVKCIQVEGDIYLAGKALVPTHNSSLTSVFWDAWEWLSHPHSKTLVASYDMSLVVRDNMKCRRIVESAEYKEILGLLTDIENAGRPSNLQQRPWGMAPDQNQKSYFENARGGFRQCVTVGGSATGKRGDKTVVDDPVKILDLIRAEPKRRVELMAEVRGWFDNVFRSRLNDLDSGKRVVIMQRVHETDLAGYLDQLPDWHVLRLPMMFEPGARADPDDPRTEAGELLFPEKFSADAIEVMRRSMTPDQWLAQYQQAPIPAEGKLIKQEYLRNRYKWVAGHWKSNPNLPPMKRVSLHFDFAQKARHSSDPSVGMTMGEGPNHEVYILDVWRVRKEYAVMEPAVLGDMETGLPGLLDSMQPHVVTFEDTAMGTAMGSTATTKQRRKNIVMVQPVNSKYIRMSTQTPWLSGGHVWFPDDLCPWMMELVTEMLAFPDCANDDQVDALSQGLQYLFDNPLDKQTHTYRTSNGWRTYEQGVGETAPGVATKELEQALTTATIHSDMLEQARIDQVKSQIKALMRR